MKTLPAILLIACLLLPHAVIAAEWRMDPSLSWRGTHDDRVLFLNEADFENRFQPRLRLQRRTGCSFWDVSGQVDVFRYVENTALDRETHDYRLRTSYDISSRLALNLDGRAAINYTFDRDWELSFVEAQLQDGDDSPPDDGSVSGEVVITERIGRYRRYTGSLTPGLRLTLDERSTLEFYLSYGATVYERETYPDHDTWGSGLTWSRAVGDERTLLFVSAAFQQALYEYEVTASRPASELKQQVYRLMAGGRRLLSETVDFTLRAGPLFTRSQAFEKSDNLSYALDASLNWRRERSRITLGVERDETDSIYGENMVRNRLWVGLSHNFSPRWRAWLGGGLTVQETEGLRHRYKEENIDLNSSLTCVLTEKTNISLGYYYRRSENKLSPRTVSANRVYVLISFRYPMLW